MELLADKFGILRVRLSEWKYMPEFARDVELAAQENIKGESYANALNAWLIKIQSDPSVADIRYINDWKGIFSPTKRYNSKTTIKIPQAPPVPPTVVQVKTTITERKGHL